MAKLSQLLMLEAMLETYDNMSVQDACVIRYQGMCIEGLVDDIIAMLDRLLSSKTRLSCRNVLVTNFETMTDTGHWLQRKLFADLPKALGKVLRDKIDQMVDLLNALMVKVIDVEADFADRFFERMKKRCRKYSTTGFDLWKAQQSKITIKGLVTYQVDLTADMLSCGILKYAGRPNGEEVQNVDKDKLALKLTDKSRLTDEFIRECAKLRRYSHWEGNRFMIDYQQLRKYLFRVFGKLTREQHIKMYKYDIQMKQIHEDIKRLEEEEKNEEIETKDSRYSSAKEIIINYVAPKLALQDVLKDKWFDSATVDRNKYSFIWRQTMVEALMRTQWAKDIAMEWADDGKRLQVKFAFIGALKDIGVLNCSYNALASKFTVNGIDSASLAKYMGYGKKKSYFEWLKQYVNQE